MPIPAKEGIYEIDGVLYVIGSRHIVKVAKALANDTRAKIIEKLLEGPRDLNELAEDVDQSKANISNQIRKLEEVGIVKSSYNPGHRGIKKYVELNVKKIVMVFEPEST